MKEKIKKKIIEELKFLCFCAVILLGLPIVYLIISNLGSLNKPTDFVCSEISFVAETTVDELYLTSSMTDVEKETLRKSILGKPISISWYDNDIRLVINSDNKDDNFILTKYKHNKDRYTYNLKKPNGVYIDLYIDRTIGFIRHIYVDFFKTDEKGLPSNYLFRLTLQPI